MFNRLTKYITCILSAVLLNACVLPSPLLAVKKRPIFKTEQMKPVAPEVQAQQPTQADQKEEEEKKETNTKNPTMQETWNKIINFEFKSLTKGDAWNIGKSFVGTACAFTVAYMIFKTKPAKTVLPNGPTNDNPDNNPINNIPNTGLPNRPTNDNPDNNPTDIPNNRPNKNVPNNKSTITVQEQLQAIRKNDPTYAKKLDDLNNPAYMQQLEKNGFFNLGNLLKQEINQLTNPTEKAIKDLIDRRHNILQRHVEKENIIQQPILASIETITQVGNSCAYHTLKNANDIIIILKKPEIVAMLIQENVNFEAIATSIRETLCSDESKARINRLFNEKERSGTWRDIIIKEKRLPDALKNSITTKLLQSTSKQNGIMRSYFVNIAQACTSYLLKNTNGINVSDIASLPDRLIDIVRDYNAKFLEDREDNYKECIQQLDIKLLQKNFDKEITKETALKDNNEQMRELYGNDLDADELDYLIKQINLENTENISIIARMETSPFVAGNAYAFSDVLKTVKAKFKDNNTCYHAFLIRDGFINITDENPHGNGHWYLGIAFKINNQLYVMTADSLNKDGRINNPEIKLLSEELKS